MIFITEHKRTVKVGDHLPTKSVWSWKDQSSKMNYI